MGADFDFYSNATEPGGVSSSGNINRRKRSLNSAGVGVDLGYYTSATEPGLDSSGGNGSRRRRSLNSVNGEPWRSNLYQPLNPPMDPMKVMVLMMMIGDSSDMALPMMTMMMMKGGSNIDLDAMMPMMIM